MEGLSPQARWAVNLLMEFVALLLSRRDAEEEESFNEQKKRTKRWSDDATTRQRIADKIFHSLSKYSLDDLDVEIILDDNDDEADDNTPLSRYHLLRQALLHHLHLSPSSIEGATLLIQSILKKEEDVIGSASLWKKQSKSHSSNGRTTPSSTLLNSSPPHPDALAALPPPPSDDDDGPATAAARLFSAPPDRLTELLHDYRISSNSRRPLVGLSQIYALSCGIRSSLSQSSPEDTLGILRECRDLMDGNRSTDVISIAVGLLACHLPHTNRHLAASICREVETSVRNHDFDSRMDERLASIVTIICRIKAGGVADDDTNLQRNLAALLDSDGRGATCWGMGIVAQTIAADATSSRSTKTLLLSQIAQRLLSLLQSCLSSECRTHILTLQSIVASSVSKGEEVSHAAVIACRPSTRVACRENRKDDCRQVCLGLALVLPAVVSILPPGTAAKPSLGALLYDIVANDWSDEIPGRGYIMSSLFHARLARGDFDQNDGDVVGDMKTLLDRCQETLRNSQDEDDVLLAMVSLSFTYKSLLRQMTTSTIETKKKMKRIDSTLSKLLFSANGNINPFAYGAFVGLCPFLPLGDCGGCPLTTPPRLKSHVTKRDVTQVAERLTDVAKREDDDDDGMMMTAMSSRWREEGILTLGLLSAMKRIATDDGGQRRQQQQQHQPQDKKRMQQQPTLPHAKENTLLNGILSPLLSYNKNKSDVTATHCLNCLFGIPLPPPYANLLHQFITTSSSEELKETSLKLLTDQISIPHRDSHDVKSFISILASTLKNHDDDNSTIFNNRRVVDALCDAYGAAVSKCPTHEVSSLTSDLWNVVRRRDGGITSFLKTMTNVFIIDKKEMEQEQKRKQSSLSPAARRSLRRFIVTSVIDDLNEIVVGWGFDGSDDVRRGECYGIWTSFVTCVSFVPSGVVIEESTKETGGSFFDISNNDPSMIISRVTTLLHLLDDTTYFTSNERKHHRHRVRRFILSNNDDGCCCSASVRRRLSLYYARLTSRHGSDEEMRDEIRYIFDQWLLLVGGRQQHHTNDDDSESIMMEWLGIMVCYFWNRHVMTTTGRSVDKPNNRRLQRRLQRVEVIESSSSFSSLCLSIDDDDNEDKGSLMTLKNVFIDGIVTSCCHDMAPKLGELCHCWDEDIDDENDERQEMMKQQWTMASPKQQQREQPLGAEVTNRAYRLESTTKQNDVKRVMRDVVRYCRDLDGDDWSRFAFIESEEILKNVMEDLK